MDKFKPQILIVEDDELIRNIFQQSLENWGYPVDTAENGQDALDKIRRKNYHIVITDLNMPIMDGMTLLNRIKSEWPYIETIVVTGFATIESAIDALKMGAFDFILKPVNFDQVKITVKKCHHKIQAEAENTHLKKINARLKELNEMKDKFLSITNHEIRTPLTIIKGYIEILDGLINSSEPEIREIFQILKSTIQELTQTVERMHTLTRANRGDWIAEPHNVDVVQVAQKVYDEMHRLFEHRSIQLEISLPHHPLYILGSFHALQIILRELLQNALKFTQDGGKVNLKIYETHKQVAICVQDNGIGIPYEKQDAIFSLFYEVQDVVYHKSSKNEFMGGGMGIGLSLVKEFVTNMKGKIVVDSDPGIGSTFVVYLPKVRQETSHKEVKPDEPSQVTFSS
ncbi:MAG: response regulator [Calditrichaeota bacterium]|nr:response regulator [Calditrichota bacterium]